MPFPWLDASPAVLTTILENEEATPPLGSRKNEERKYKNDT
jgi:hypothetical protein